MSGPSFDDMAGRHFKTRAVGQIYSGPLRAVGYDNKVMKVTFQEMEFKNSVESQRYMDQIRKKYAGRKQLMNSRRMKHISKDDDR